MVLGEKLPLKRITKATFGFDHMVLFMALPQKCQGIPSKTNQIPKPIYFLGHFPINIAQETKTMSKRKRGEQMMPSIDQNYFFK